MLFSKCSIFLMDKKYNDDKYIMNKPNKITLPVIALTSDKAQMKGKKKFFKAWMMNDSTSNWKNKNQKQKITINAQQDTLLSLGNTEQVLKKKLNKGITLAEYFRTNSLLQQKDAQGFYNVSNEQILPYITQNFQIHQTDEENYQQSQNNRQMFNVPQNKIKQQLSIKNVQILKVKTQADEQIKTQRIFIQPLKKKSNSYRSKIQNMSQMQHSFQLKPRSKSRALSNQILTKLLPIQNTRKILNKVKESDKTKISQLTNVNLMTKYSNKFHLNQISSINIAIPKIINKIQ